MQNVITLTKLSDNCSLKLPWYKSVNLQICCWTVMTMSHVQCNNYNQFTTLLQHQYAILYTHLTSTLSCDIAITLSQCCILMLTVWQQIWEFTDLRRGNFTLRSINLLTAMWQCHFGCWEKSSLMSWWKKSTWMIFS